MIPHFKTNLLPLILLLGFLTAPVQAFECKALASQGLSLKQQETLHKAFKAGEVHDMSYSLAAIAWKESSAGKYLVNLQDPSAGVFMVTVRNAISYIKWKDTPFNRNRVAQLLIQDFQLSAEFAMMNLQFWKDQYGEDWRKIYTRFNGGYSDSGASKKYAQDVIDKIGVISTCNWRKT